MTLTRGRRDRKADSNLAWAYMNAVPADQRQRVTVKILAEHLGCSTGHAAGLPAWKSEMERRLRSNQPTPRTVSLTAKLGSTIGAGDETLDELIEQQSDDDRNGNKLRRHVRHHS